MNTLRQAQGERLRLNQKLKYYSVNKKASIVFATEVFFVQCL
jgi:hypothetical protein